MSFSRFSMSGDGADVASAATLARPLKSARGKAAANFAVSMRTK